MKNRVIGLTGQTGAGKSTVAGFAKALGCRIIDADLVAREALESGSECLKELSRLFGSDILDENGCCRRDVLARRAFSGRENTELLNKTTHPWIIRRIKEYIENSGHEGLVVIDAPLLFESGADGLCGCVIAVTAPERLRLDRIMKRDGISSEDALLRMRAQHEDEFYTSRAEYIINGSAPEEEVKKQTEEIIRQLLQRGES